MECERVGDEGLQGDKMDVLYGEADAAARARVEAHLAGCAACREELRGAARRCGATSRAWRLPRRAAGVHAARAAWCRAGWRPRRSSCSASARRSARRATLSLRRALAAQEARAAAARAAAARGDARPRGALARRAAGGRRAGAPRAPRRAASTSGCGRASPQQVERLDAPARRLAGAGRGAAACRHGAGGGQPQLPGRPPRRSSSRARTS